MFRFFNNVGIIETRLSKDVLKKLNNYIKKPYEKENHKLAGNLSNSFLIKDKKNWFFNNVLDSIIKEYTNEYTLNETVPTFSVEKKEYVLNRFWVNFQKKYEFNPIHKHTGVFSFVGWIKIPSSYKKECELPFVKDANVKCANTFQMLFINSLGNISQLNYNLEPEDEGKMLFFSSQLNHCVYPFYLSNKERISISGNISLITKN